MRESTSRPVPAKCIWCKSSDLTGSKLDEAAAFQLREILAWGLAVQLQSLQGPCLSAALPLIFTCFPGKHSYLHVCSKFLIVSSGQYTQMRSEGYIAISGVHAICVCSLAPNGFVMVKGALHASFHF
jgi:hypothetical protein